MIEPAPPSTIKEKILTDIASHADTRGRTTLSPDQIAKRHGLNGHDLVKNLEQLRQEGFIDLAWGEGGRVRRVKLKRSALNERRLGSVIRLAPPKSVAESVRQWLLRQPQQKDGWVYATPSSIKEALGDLAGSGTAVNVAISDMQTRGLVETKKDGMRITAVRILPENLPAPAGPEPRGASVEQIASAAGPGRRVPIPEVPALRQYAQAKQAWLQRPDNPYIRIEFDQNDAAEDGLKLLQMLEGNPT